MKKLFTILGLFVALSASSQTTVNPSNSNTCFGQSVTLVASVMGYDADTLNFNWYLGTTLQGSINDTINITPSTVGSNTVTVQVTDSVGSGTQPIGTIAFATIFVNSNPIATASNGGPYCQSNGPIQLQASGGINYSWAGPNGFSSNAQNPNRPALTANAGTYTVTVTSNGCSSTATTNVAVNSLPTASITVSPNDTVCQGTTVALFATGGNSYLWSTNQTGPSITPTPNVGNTTFTVQVTDANGCSATASQLIIVRPNPVVNAIGINATCNGLNNGSAVVTAAVGAPFSYSWNTGATTANILSLSPAVYTATVTNTFGCTASDTATVGQPTLLTASISASTNVSCNGGSNGTATVSVIGGTGSYNYNWTGPGVGLNPRTNLPIGIHTVTVSDANGCSDTATVTITQPLPLTANADSTSTTCFGDNNGTAFVSFINGGVAPYVYVWNNGQTGSSISNLSAGNYTATITDANGCTITAATVVTQPSPVGFTFVQTNVTCNGGSNGSITVTANGGIAPYQYQLNGGNWGTSNTFSGLIAGQHTIMVRDTNQCAAGPTNVIITQPNALTVTVGVIAQACDSLGQAWATVSGGQGPYTYSWSNGLGTNDSIQTVAGAYNVTVIDANNCQAFGIAAIATPQPVNITGIATNPTCFASQNGSINITVTGAAPITYLWSNTATTEDITGLGAPGTYTVIATASNGCQDTTSYSLVNPTPLNISSNNDTTACFGTASGTLTALATGGTGSYSFAWSPSGGTASTVTGLGAGAYTVVVTDANGCTATDLGQVFNAPQLIVSNSVTNSQCAGSNTGTIDITVIGGTGLMQYWWTGPNGFTQISGDIVNLAPGNYNLTVTDANNCTATHSAVVNGPTNPIVAQFVNVQVPCTGQNNGSLTINASGGTPPFTYLWNNGETTAVNNSLTPGNYTVTITDANGCVYGPMGQTLLGNPSMNITIPAELTNYCVGSGIPQGPTISGGTFPYAVQWEDPNGILFATSEQIEPLMSGLYTLTVIDGSQCSQTMYVPVTLVTCTLSGIHDLSSENITIFPNPISSGSNVVITLPNTIHEVNIELKNITGQILFQDKTSDAQYTLNTSGLSSGTYMVQIASRNQLITKKLVVQQ
jgi:hypothetical protein